MRKCAGVSNLLAILLTAGLLKSPKSLKKRTGLMEARVGIEPTNGAFAEPCLTTWLPRRPGERKCSSSPFAGKLLRSECRDSLKMSSCELFKNVPVAEEALPGRRSKQALAFQEVNWQASVNPQQTFI
jgi:hypothetical protein